MAKIIADGVIEAVRYNEQKNISMARVYLRHGLVYSDCVLLKREQLIEAMQNGKRFFSGTRKTSYASTFFLNQELTLHEQNGTPFIGVKTSNSTHDDAEIAPLF